MLEIDTHESFQSVGHIAAELNASVRTIEEIAAGLGIVARRLNGVTYLREADVDRLAERVRPGRVSGSFTSRIPTIIA